MHIYVYYIYICILEVIKETLVFSHRYMHLYKYTSTVLDYPYIRLARSVGRASERKSEGREFESHVRMTLYLESKNLSTTLNIIYIYIYLRSQM